MPLSDLTTLQPWQGSISLVEIELNAPASACCERQALEDNPPVS